MNMDFPRIVIAALTYNRPDGLKNLVNGLNAIHIPKNTDIDIFIVDNSAEHSAKAALDSYKTWLAPPLHFIHEPQKGIACARNHCLDYALKQNADLLFFIDDDEFPQPNWVLAHLANLMISHAQASIGQVVPSFVCPPPKWISDGRYLYFDPALDGEILQEGNTSNCAIRLDPIRALGLKFDTKFDHTGGEDTDFFERLLCSGAQIIYTKDAIVEETIVPHRATFFWLFKRWVRTGNTSARVMQSDLLHRGINLGTGLMRLGIGLLLSLIGSLILLLDRKVIFFEGLRIVARGLGFICASFDYYYAEYEVVNR